MYSQDVNPVRYFISDFSSISALQSHLASYASNQDLYIRSLSVPSSANLQKMQFANYNLKILKITENKWKIQQR